MRPNEDVLRLYVPMDDVLFMDVVKSQCDLSYVPCGSMLFKLFSWLLYEFVEELAVFCKLKDKVYGKIIFEMVIEFDYVGMVELVHDLDFCFDVVE